MPAFWSNLNGAFELAASGDPAHGIALLTRTVGEPILWSTSATRPISVVGDTQNWDEIVASVDFSIVNAGGSVVVAVFEGIRTM
jgi:DNA mismatch repair protein MutH